VARSDEDGPEPAPEAAGLGLNAYLAGAHAIEGGRMRRQPALDATTIGLGVISAGLAVAFLLRRRNC
jgi:hypothetical protein